MPWCPVCRAEYREGVHSCTDCNVALVDALRPDEDREDNSASNDRWVFLAEIGDDNEADIIESLFRANDIPLWKKYKGAGEIQKIYVGRSNLGIDLLVPERRLGQAKELLGIPEKQNQPGEHKPHPAPEEKAHRQHRGLMTLFVVCLFLAIVMGLILEFSHK